MTADSAAPSGPEELTADELLRLCRAPGELTATEAAALARLDGDPGDDDDGDCDPRWEPPGQNGDLGSPDGLSDPGDLTGRARCSRPGSPTATAAPGPGSRRAARWM